MMLQRRDTFMHAHSFAFNVLINDPDRPRSVKMRGEAGVCVRRVKCCRLMAWMGEMAGTRDEAEILMLIVIFIVTTGHYW